MDAGSELRQDIQETPVGILDKFRIEGQEVLKDNELFRYRVRIRIRKVMRIYNEMLEQSTADIVDALLGGSGFQQSVIKSKNKVNRKLEDEVIKKISAENYVRAVDEVVYSDIKGLYREIIHNRYMEEMTVDKTYYVVKKDYLKIPLESSNYSRSTFYRDKYRAEVMFYRKINQKIKNI